MADSSDTSTGVVDTYSRFTDDDLRTVETFADAFGANGLVKSVEDYSEAYGSGFAVLETNDKDRLVKTAFGIVEWRFSTGDQGEFVSALVITERTNEKYVLNDGSTGICDQLRRVTADRLAKGWPETEASRGLYVKNGLRRSDYLLDAAGQPMPKGSDPGESAGTGTTYYLNN